MRTKVGLAAFVLLSMTGCSTLDEWWRGGPREISRDKPGVAQLACAEGKTLAVRMDGQKSAWIVLPDREYRLDAVPGGYSNGRTTLVVKGDVMSLEEANTPAIAGCKAKS